MNTLKINGTTLTGIYVDAAVSYNKPAKNVTNYRIPGRNGALIIDEGTFDNVLISYPVYEKDTFPTEFDQLVNYLASLEGYQRIECSNDPGHFRLGRFVVPEAPTAKRLNRDGFYTLTFDCKPQRFLTSGEAETEIDNAAVVIASDNAPYLFRKSGGAQDITGADRETPTLIGGTVAWNQLEQFNQNSSSAGGVSWVNNNDGTYTLSNTATGTGRLEFTTNAYSPDIVSGHKYFGWSNLQNASADLSYVIVVGGTLKVVSNKSYAFYTSTTDTGKVHGGIRWTSGQATGIKVTGGLIDLTLAFGSTIADYLYTLESGTAGAGIAKLKEWGFLGKPYYAYDAGSLQSVNASEHRTTGRNQLATTWEQGYWDANGTKLNNSGLVRMAQKVPVISGVHYAFHRSITTGYWQVRGFDANGAYVGAGNATLTLVSGGTGATATNPMRIGGDTCVVEFKDGIKYFAINDTSNDASTEVTMVFGDTPLTGYVPYESHTYALDSSLTLRGIPKLDANNNLYYDGDEYTSDGKVVRKYGIRAYASGDATDGSTMITDGTNTVYKLTTPTEETAEGFTSPQIVDVDGTEQFVDYGVEQSTRDVAIPVGHETDYFNAIGYPITNPTYFKSKPKIRVYGSGTFTIANMTITVAAHSQPYIDIDSELQDCYYEDTNMNSYVSFSGNDYPVLAPGVNGIMPTSGITKLEVTPRWWVL